MALKTETNYFGSWYQYMNEHKSRDPITQELHGPTTGLGKKHMDI